MGVEILGAVQGQGKEEIDGEITSLHELDGEKSSESPDALEPIKFGLVDGSHITNGSAEGEAIVAKDDKFPKDAAEEWPEPKQIHSFYFVKFRSYEDPKLKMKIDQADKEIQKRNQARSQITDALKAKRSERALVIEKLKPLTSQQREYKRALDEKKKELEPLQAALGKLRSSNNTREKGVAICSSEEELNERIQSLHYQIQHESNTLVEEKQLLRDIKQLEGTRDKVAAHAAMQSKIQDSFGQKEVIQDHVKLIGGDLDGVRKEQQTIWAKIQHLMGELKIIDEEIKSLQDELEAVTKNREKAYGTLHELRKEREEVNVPFYQYRSLLITAKDLAAKKDVAALQELSHRETEKFISLWSSNKAVRDDYERRILPSLDSRQLSRDGRMRNPDEKPIAYEAPMVVEKEAAPAKANIKRTKGDASTPFEHDHVTASMVQKEEPNKPTEAEKKGKGSAPQDEEAIFSVAAPQKEPLAVVDPVKLKEMKREEEMAKAKLALERKKKLAEKAAAKAAARAQKEAEKKLKEREKKAKKKAGPSASFGGEADEQNDTETSNAEAEDVEEKVEAPVAVSKSKETKENVRYRNRPRGQGPPLPKVILKKKQSPPFWVWAVPAAAAAVLVLGLLGYYFVAMKN